MLRWRGPFDPEAFDMEAVNSALKAAFSARASKPRRAGESSPQ
jgi:hypothetical protein